MPSLVLFVGLVSISLPAAAQVYPVNGVFSAIDPKYPADRNEACMALKTFGVEAVSKQAIPGLIIFSKNKRYEVKRNVQTEKTIKSIKETNGGFRITEWLTNARRLLGFRKKMTYFLKVLDPITIEIWDGTTVTRYAKCESKGAPFSEFHGEPEAIDAKDCMGVNKINFDLSVTHSKGVIGCYDNG